MRAPHAIGFIEMRVGSLQPFTALPSVGHRRPRDAECVEPAHLLVLGWEPSKGRPLDDVVERQQPPHEHLGCRFLRAPAVLAVLDAERPVDRFVRDVDGPRTSGARRAGVDAVRCTADDRMS